MKRMTLSKAKATGVVALVQATTFMNPSVVFGQEASEGIRGGINSAKPSSATDVGLFDDGGIFQKIANILLFLVGAVSVIMLIIGGIRYVISAGDQNAVTSAKNTILYAIVGIVISFLAFAAVDFVVSQLEG